MLAIVLKFFVAGSHISAASTARVASLIIRLFRLSRGKDAAHGRRGRTGDLILRRVPEVMRANPGRIAEAYLGALSFRDVQLTRKLSSFASMADQRNKTVRPTFM